jgi:hypothetical protein
MIASDCFLSQIVVSDFHCEKCHYKCSRKYDYEKHINTKKHKMIANDSLNDKNVAGQLLNQFACICGKIYKQKTNMYRHRKTCLIMNQTTNMSETDLVKFLLKENQEFKQLIIEQSSKMLELASNQTGTSIATINNNINNNTNCNNKQQFNLNVFLNENCKDAMNMSDFIDSIKVNDEDFENIGKLGYVQGISNIFIKNLQKLDECVRPMHCSDAKREVIYIKDNNEWKKDENQKAVRHVIAMIAHKNFKYMPFWTDANPGVFDGSTKKNDLFLKITNQITTAITPDDDIGICKIIRNVANRVVIDKSGGLS